MHCRWCKEEMTYGPQSEIMTRFVKINGKNMSKSVKYEQYGWVCRLKEDPCDVVFDPKDYEKNRTLSMEAEERLSSIIANQNVSGSIAR